MHILVVGNVLKDVYLDIDSRTEDFEPDGTGVEWLDFSFDASKHHYVNRMSSFGGAAITLEVLQKMGLTADISDTSFRFSENGPMMNGPTGTYRYILASDKGVTYMVPSVTQKTAFTTPTETVDYLFVDRSACFSPEVVDRITSYLDYSKKTKLVIYVKKPGDESMAGLIKRADLVFLEDGKGRLEGYPKEKVIYVSERRLRYLDYEENITVERIERLTHLSAFSIIAATILGGFILGKTVEYSLKMARINVENATLDSTLSLEELENIAASTSESSLEMIAAALMTPGKGVLAADESGGSIKKKFETLGIADTEENRHNFREMLLMTPEIENYLSGVILFDETARDKMATGASVPDYLISKGIIPGIKVDKGLGLLIDLPEGLDVRSKETYTKGLEGLPQRLREYYQMGMRFTKWRAAFEIELSHDGEVVAPTEVAIRENCRDLAVYAANAQSAGLVPIVEPEVVYDGRHSIEQCEVVTGKILDELFKELRRHGVKLKACILKVNMVISGKRHGHGSGAAGEGFSPDEVAAATIRTLRDHVPLELAGVVFLSGGQTPEQATDNLSAIMSKQPFAWPVTFSFARALQGPAMETWGGKAENTEAGKNALREQLEENTRALKSLR